MTGRGTRSRLGILSPMPLPGGKKTAARETPLSIQKTERTLVAKVKMLLGRLFET